MKAHSHPEKFPPGVQKPETDQDIKVSHHHPGTQMLSRMDLALELTLQLQFCTQNGSKPLSPAMNSGGALVYAMGRSTPQLCHERLKGKIDLFFLEICFWKSPIHCKSRAYRIFCCFCKEKICYMEAHFLMWSKYCFRPSGD